jgi:hypothetical protein
MRLELIVNLNQVGVLEIGYNNLDPLIAGWFKYLVPCAHLI